MLDEKFLSRMGQAFPAFHERVDEEAREDARRLLQEAEGDVQRALLHGRFLGAGRLWWPYVRGSVPVVGDDRAAMEQFARIVLTVDHLLGRPPASLEAARDRVLDVLRHSLDVERLARLAGREGPDAGKATAATAGLLASLAALWAPVGTVRRVAKGFRWLPVPAKIGVGAIVVAALASIPVMAGYSAAHNAERSARGWEVGTIEAPDGSVSYHSVTP
jgi:hypothetical protein